MMVKDLADLRHKVMMNKVNPVLDQSKERQKKIRPQFSDYPKQKLKLKQLHLDLMYHIMVMSNSAHAHIRTPSAFTACSHLFCHYSVISELTISHLSTSCRL